VFSYVMCRFVAVFRSEIPSGICAKLRTVAASNHRVHMPWSLCCCLFGPCMVLYGVVLHSHPVRGESHIWCNITGEVATAAYVFYMSVTHLYACFMSVVCFVHCFLRCDANNVFMHCGTVFDLTKFWGALTRKL